MMITKYLISGIAILLVLSSCTREKRSEITPQKYLFEVTNKVLVAAIDSFIVNNSQEKDNAINVLIRQEKQGKLIHLTRMKCLNGYFKKSNSPQFITNYKGTELFISFDNFDGLFETTMLVEKNDNNEYIDRLIVDGPMTTVVIPLNDSAYLIVR